MSTATPAPDVSVSGLAKVVVYVKELDHCPQCNLTLGKLDKHGVTYETIGIDLPEHVEALETFKTRGFTSAPVVVVYDADDVEVAIWAGFQPARLDERFNPKYVARP